MSSLDLDLRGVCRVLSQRDWDLTRMVPTKGVRNARRTLTDSGEKRKAVCASEAVVGGAG